MKVMTWLATQVSRLEILKKPEAATDKLIFPTAKKLKLKKKKLKKLKIKKYAVIPWLPEIDKPLKTLYIWAPAS